MQTQTLQPNKKYEFLTYNKIKSYLKHFQLDWTLKQREVSELLTFSQKIDKEMITYPLLFMWVTDYSLIYDHGIFEFKLPSVFLSLLDASHQQLIDLVQLIIKFEKNNKKKMSDIELFHCIYLKNLVDFVLDIRCVDLKTKKKIIAGDVK